MPFDRLPRGRCLIRKFLQRLHNPGASDAEVEDAKFGSRRSEPVEIDDHVRCDGAANLLEGLDVLGAVNPLSQESGRKYLIDLIIPAPAHLFVDGWRNPDPILQISPVDKVAPA